MRGRFQQRKSLCRLLRQKIPALRGIGHMPLCGKPYVTTGLIGQRLHLLRREVAGTAPHNNTQRRITELASYDCRIFSAGSVSIKGSRRGIRNGFRYHNTRFFMIRSCRKDRGQGFQLAAGGSLPQHAVVRFFTTSKRRTTGGRVRYQMISRVGARKAGNG